jgi:acetyl-CoA decarbonylase/synthase, CODH/ACS complex subunit gamma
MPLTGLQIFKLLPNTNCKDCGYPTCLAFAMKLAAGKEALAKCPHASEACQAALGAASAPPIRAVTIGRGERAITVGEETVFFRHEKTFVRPTGLFRVLDPTDMAEPELGRLLDEWAALRLDRAGEIFRIDGIALLERARAGASLRAAAQAAATRGFPVALLAASADGAKQALEPIRADRPLLVAPLGVERAPYVKLALELGLPLAISAPDLPSLAEAAAEAVKAGVTDVLLEPPASGPRELDRHLSQIRRGALDRIHPGLGHPVLVRVGPGELAKGITGITRFASLLAIADTGGETWLPYWTLRQNIFTDPQKPLQIDPGIYPIGEPDAAAPLLVTTNFSLTYFIVSTELEGTGVPCRLAVVDSEGMSVLTAWSAGKFGGDKVAKALREMGGPGLVSHKTVIIPGHVASISGELEDSLGDGWQVLTGPQEASDIGAFFRDVWPGAHA